MILSMWLLRFDILRVTGAQMGSVLMKCSPSAFEPASARNQTVIRSIREKDQPPDNPVGEFSLRDLRKTRAPADRLLVTSSLQFPPF